MPALICTYFNPRSREGSDAKEEGVEPESGISIHAPARGATGYGSRKICHPRFQSTLPRGERRKRTGTRQKTDYFNPRSREGSDKTVTFNVLATAPFQSTLPRGERPVTVCTCTTCLNFNPRSREGSDSTGGHPFRSLQDFNPRSREGSDSGNMAR